MAELNEKIVKGLVAPERGNKVTFYTGAVLQGKEAPAGFGVCVTANGSKSFVLNYRNRDRKERRLTIGQWPTWSALAAVKEARELRQRIDRGEDPLGDKRQKKQEGTNTFKAICEEFFRRDGAELRTKDDRQNELKRLAWPKLGAKAIEVIKRTDIIRLLDDVADNSGPVMADRLLAYMRRVMNWHASRSDTYNSPIVRGMARTKSKERARQRILTDDEIRRVWGAAQASRGPFGALVRFTLLTGARRAEAAQMAWQEFDEAVWTLPASRNKTKVDLLRPLNRRARAVLPPKAGKFVFSTDGGNTAIAGFSQLRRAFYKASGTSGWTVHDLRRTARSLMSRAGVSTDHAERCLGHIIGGVRGVYDRHEYFDEKAKAYEALASLIERIVNPQDNVVQLAGAHGR